jgi:hypothetical protein
MVYIGDNAMEVEPVATDNLGPLAKLILPELPGCDDLMVRMKLGAALREFCRETNACVVTMPAKVIRNDKGYDYIYAPPAPEGMVIGSLLSVKNFDGTLVEWGDGDINRGMIVIGRGARDEFVNVSYSVYPKAGGEACPERFVERYAEAITSGAMHKLLSMTNKPWSDPNRAAQYGAEYADAISEASYRSTGSQLSGGAENAIPQGGLFM